jgi:hypothetical protein
MLSIVFIIVVNVKRNESAFTVEEDAMETDSEPETQTPVRSIVHENRRRQSEPRMHLLQNESYARCNDGTASGIHFQVGSGGYIIMLQGGGQCSNINCLQYRQEHLLSSKNMIEGGLSGPFSGIMSPYASISPLANYSAVMIHYCSSDAWMGDKSDVYTSTDFHDANISEYHKHKWKHFRGARIVDAVFRLLTDPQRETERSHLGLPQLNNDEPVVFGGFSAGARGAMVHADGIRQRFNLKWMRTFLDSGYWIDLGADSSLRNEMQFIYSRYVQGSEFASLNQINEWKDLFGQYRMMKMSSSFFLIMSQADTFQLTANYDFLPGLLDRISTSISEGLLSLVPISNCTVIHSDRSSSHAETGSDYGCVNIGIPDTYFYKLVDDWIKISCHTNIRIIQTP